MLCLYNERRRHNNWPQCMFYYASGIIELWFLFHSFDEINTERMLWTANTRDSTILGGMCWSQLFNINETTILFNRTFIWATKHQSIECSPPWTFWLVYIFFCFVFVCIFLFFAKANCLIPWKYFYHESSNTLIVVFPLHRFTMVVNV